MPKRERGTIKNLHVNVDAAFFKIAPKFFLWNRHIHGIYFEIGIPCSQELHLLRRLKWFLFSILNLVNFENLESGD